MVNMLDMSLAERARYRANRQANNGQGEASRGTGNISVGGDPRRSNRGYGGGNPLAGMTVDQIQAAFKAGGKQRFTYENGRRKMTPMYEYLLRVSDAKNEAIANQFGGGQYGYGNAEYRAAGSPSLDLTRYGIFQSPEELENRSNNQNYIDPRSGAITRQGIRGGPTRAIGSVDRSQYMTNRALPPPAPPYHPNQGYVPPNQGGDSYYVPPAQNDPAQMAVNSAGTSKQPPGNSSTDPIRTGTESYAGNPQMNMNNLLANGLSSTLGMRYATTPPAYRPPPQPAPYDPSLPPNVMPNPSVNPIANPPVATQPSLGGKGGVMQQGGQGMAGKGGTYNPGGGKGGGYAGGGQVRSRRNRMRYGRPY